MHSKLLAEFMKMPGADVHAALLPYRPDVGPATELEKMPCNAFIGINYIPAASDPDHDVPAEVLNQACRPVHLGGHKPCATTCVTCATDCRKCKSCPLHIDSKDKGLTILHLYQSSRTPVTDRVYFVLGNVAHPIAGGMSFIFDGKTVRHGVWAPDSCGYDWTGLALVTR